MVDDQIKVTHDNNGRFYRIKMDLAKEGSEIWDLTPYFKGRVGDNRFGLQVVWTYQGRLLDTTGMKPYIEGNVGNYSFDDKKDLQLAPDAATVRYTGNPSDCQSGGRATYYFPEQMFPRDGIFKGYIGLLDDRDDSSHPHISGVTVWFRVLPGIAQMGHACDVYISDLDKALQNFKVKLDQHDKDYQTQLQQVIDDARNAYESETKNAHDAAVAAVAELNRTREDNNNLADLIQSIENNIKANNIVTRPEYDKLANEIVNRLSQINTKPDYYDNYNDMVAAKPNGTQDLCVTADNEHKWLYVNGQWLDLGEFSYADIAPALKNSLYSQEHGNVLVNPDMRDGGYGWNVVSPWVANSDNNIDNSQSYGIYVQNIPANTAYEIFQNPIPVYKHKVLSAGVKVWTNNAESADIQILFRDANQDIIDNAIYRENIPANIPEWRTIKLENVSIPDNAVSAAFTISMLGKGIVNICQPMVNFEPYLLPYSIKEAREQLSYNQDNVLVNPDMKNGAYGWNVTSPWVANTDNNIDNSQSYGIYVKDEPPQNVAYEIFQNPIPVYKHKVLSAGVKVWTNNAESADIQILFRDANQDIIDNAIYRENIPANIPEWRTIKLENISIPDNAVSAAFTISMLGKGVLNICQPQVNFEPSLYPYSIKEVQDSLTEMQENESHKLPYFTFNTDAANVNDKWITAPFAYNDGLREIKGYAQIAIQGDSSRGYPKKNYKIKLFSDSDCKQKMKVKMKANWASLANFNLKANWIDATQSRNLVGAKLMADATAVTPFQDDKVAENLSKSQAYGQMEGFPIEVWFGTDYHGLYSCNTKKADSSFGMDKDTKGTAVISVLDNVNNPSSQTLRIPTAKLDNVAYADELHDTPDPDLVTNWSAWLDFVNNSSDTDFKAKLSNYIDINSAINLYLFGVMSREYDYESKSVLYLTWDNGKTYYLVAYDLDSNWGQNVSGAMEGNPQDDKWGFSTETASHKDGSFVDNAGMNKLFERMFQLFKPEIKQQYQYLRKTVWRNDQIIRSYKDYLEKIPEAVLEKDEAKWPQIPSVKDNNFEQLHQIITQRCNQMDNWIEQLVPPVQPTAPQTQPASGTTPATPQPTTPQAQPTEPKQ